MPWPRNAPVANPWKVVLGEFEELLIQDGYARDVCPNMTPADVLALAHPATNDSVDGGLNEVGRDSSACTLACAVVDQRTAVSLQMRDHVHELATWYCQVVR